MSDLCNIKPLIKSNMVMPVNTNITSKDPGKKKKDKKALNKEEASKKGHVSEYI